MSTVPDVVAEEEARMAETAEAWERKRLDDALKEAEDEAAEAAGEAAGTDAAAAAPAKESDSAPSPT